MIFSGRKAQATEVMRTTGLHALIGQSSFHVTADAALRAISREIAEQGIAGAFCLLPEK